MCADETLSLLGATGGRRQPDAVSLEDAAYNIIKNRIITCKLRPGTTLSEAALAANIGYGRTPVHQAMTRLMHESLVEILPRKGILVRPVSLDEILEIIEVRLINECSCVRRASKHADTHAIAELEANLWQLKDATKSRDTERLMHLDRDFHIAISSAAGNAVHAQLLRTLHERSLRFWFISLRAAPDHHIRICEQHEAIVNAIIDHDPDDAEVAMREHIEAFRANIMHQI